MRLWLCALGALFVASMQAGAGPLDELEDDFERAIGRIGPATVVCLPAGIEKDRVPMATSGVLLTRTGLVLSDSAVGHYVDVENKKQIAKFLDQIEVRVPNLKGKGFRSYSATVLYRSTDPDTSLLRVQGLPGETLRKHMHAGISSEVRVGDFLFVMGNSFGMAEEAPPTLTAGIVSAFSLAAAGGGEGAYKSIFTSAAVNPGVNGGPVANAEGLLIGTVSNTVAADSPYQFLGEIVPVDRLRAHYGKFPEGAELFPEKPATGVRTKSAAGMERVFHDVGRFVAQRALVGLEIKRKEGKSLQRLAPAQNGILPIPSNPGPVSGVLVDARGWVATSLYNLTNVEPLLTPGWTPPPDATLRAGIESIESVVAFLPGGRSVPARLLGWNELVGIALFGVDPALLPSTMEPLLPVEAPDQLAIGRFVLACGWPYGATGAEDPLLTMGVLSKAHGALAEDSWRGNFQTDAGITDGNVGGAAVDLEGKLFGLTTLWSPLRHGRNSGIGFIVPWSMLADVLVPLSEGRRPAYLGISSRENLETGAITIASIDAESAAAAAGLAIEDVIVAIGGVRITSGATLAARMRTLWAGDRVPFTVQGQDGAERVVEVVLGERP